MSVARLIQMGTAGVSAGGGEIVWNDPDIAIASYDSVSLSLSPYTAIRGLFLKDDGTKLYALSAGDTDVKEYNLSTAWDVSSGTYNQAFDVGNEEGNPNTIFFKDDGTKMYILGRNGDDVNEYNLSTAWDISSASYSQVFSVASQETNPFGMFFKPDGLKLYIIGLINTTVFEYTLTTAWDVSTASYSSNSFSISSQDTAPREINFNDDGTKMWMLGATNDAVFEYDLSTAWDVSSASYNSVSFSVSSQETSPTAFRFKSDGSKMYVVGALNTVYQYTTPAAITWSDPDIANLSYDSVSLDLNLAANLRGMVFKPDGTKLYLAHDTGFDSIKEYTMSSAWDISTLSLNNSLDLTGVINATFGIYIKPDGSALYVVNGGSDRIERFNFSTNWDISTISTPASQTFSITTNNNNPKGMFFKPDGTKMYVCGMGADGVVEYTLSTAWDITTASYQSLFSTATQSVYPSCVTFNEDGTRMYITTFSSSSDIFEYSLSTGWDVSTASYNSVSYNDSVLVDPYIHAFKSDGSKAYFIDDTDIIYQYTT